MKPERSDRWAILGLTLLTAVLFREVLFGGQVFYERDVLLVFYSQAETFFRCIRAGSWPVWDPYMGYGQPMLANPGAQILYPWTWLNLVCLPETWFTIFATSHLLLSGLGLYAFSRRLDLSPPASVTAAAVWMLSGPLLSLVSTGQHFAGATWIPWTLLAADSALRLPGLRRALLWGAVLGVQILAGSFDMCVISGLLQAAYSVRYLRGLGSWRQVARRIAAPAAIALVFALALGAGLWLPAAEQVRASARAELTEDVRTYWSLHPVNLLQALMPVFFHALPLRGPVRALLFEGREPFLSSVYLGMAALPLVVASFLGPRLRLACFLGAAAITAGLLALGKFGIAYPLAVALLPPLRVFRYPSKAMIVAGLAWALLAGVGYDAWRDPGRGSARRWALFVVVPTAVAAILTGIVAFLAARRADAWAPLFLSPDASGRSFAELLAPAVRKLLVVGGLTAAAAVALVTARARARRFAAGFAATAAVLAVADLLFVHRPLNPTALRELTFRRPAVFSALHLGDPTRDPTRVYVFDYFLHVMGRSAHNRAPSVTPAREVSGLPAALGGILLSQDCLTPPSGQRWGLYGSYDYDILSLYPAPLRNLTLLLRAVEETPGFGRLLRLGGVAYVVAQHNEGLEELSRVATVSSPLAGPIHVFAVPGHLPRTYAVSGARIVGDPADALKTLLDPGFDPSREILLPAGAARASNAGFAGESGFATYLPDRVRIDAALDEPGFVVLLDAYDPGWHATVDGEEAPLLRANVAFRAVPVPAGRHTVEMRYRPRAVTVGLLISSLALLAGFALLVPLRSGTRENR